MLKLRREQWEVLSRYWRDRFITLTHDELRGGSQYGGLNDEQLFALLEQAVDLAAAHGMSGKDKVLRLMALLHRWGADMASSEETPWASRALSWDTDGDHKLAALELYSEQAVIEQRRAAARKAVP